MNYKKIDDLLTAKDLSFKLLAERIGVTRTGLYHTIKNKTLTVSALEKIAEVFEVPVIVFFEDENEKWTKSALIDEVKKLDEENEVLWNRIDELMDTIRAKRSILRLTYTQLKSLQDSRLNEIISAIDESENFENHPVREKRKILGIDLGTNSIGMAITDSSDAKKPEVEVMINQMKESIGEIINQTENNPSRMERIDKLRENLLKLEKSLQISSGNQ